MMTTEFEKENCKRTMEDRWQGEMLVVRQPVWRTSVVQIKKGKALAVAATVGMDRLEQTGAGRKAGSGEHGNELQVAQEKREIILRF